jgi:hypothetical protein
MHLLGTSVNSVEYSMVENEGECGERITNASLGFLTGGYKKDLHVADLVADHPEFIEDFPFALTTSLDGSPPTSLNSVRRALVEHVDEFREVGSGVLLSGQQTVLLADRYPLFTHLDEVWLFRNELLEPKPEEVTIVLPRYNLSEEVPTQVANWMLRSGCIVGLGDEGIGLNYVTVDERIARWLAEY